jgi:hypothetical protein
MNLDIRPIYIGIVILFFLMVIVFSTVTISYHSTSKRSATPIDLLDNRTNTGLQVGINNDNYSMNSISNIKHVAKDVGKFNPYAPKMGLVGLPEKDQYMTHTLKNQIDTLADRYYYDNCKFKLT